MARLLLNSYQIGVTGRCCKMDQPRIERGPRQSRVNLTLSKPTRLYCSAKLFPIFIGERKHS